MSESAFILHFFSKKLVSNCECLKSSVLTGFVQSLEVGIFLGKTVTFKDL